MEFKEFADTVRDVIERDFTGGTPVDVEKTATGADFTVPDGIGRLTSVHGLVQVALDKNDGTIVTPRHSEPIEATLEHASKVARFFARGADDDV